MMSLKAFDAFPKINEDFNRRTLSGGVITLGAALIMSALFLNELGTAFQVMLQSTFRALVHNWQSTAAGIFLSTETVNELSVDLSRGERLAIHVWHQGSNCLLAASADLTQACWAAGSQLPRYAV